MISGSVYNQVHFGSTTTHQPCEIIPFRLFKTVNNAYTAGFLAKNNKNYGSLKIQQAQCLLSAENDFCANNYFIVKTLTHHYE